MIRIGAIVVLLPLLLGACTGVLPPHPSRLEVIFDGERLVPVGGVPASGEIVLVVRNSSDVAIHPELVRLPRALPTRTEMEEAARNGVALLGTGVLPPRRTVPGRLAPRLIEEQHRLHLHLGPGAYLLVADRGLPLDRTEWLAFQTLPADSAATQ